MWIDVHAHLSELTPESLADVVESARGSRVSGVVNTATDLHSASVVLEQCAQHDMLRAAVGISPFDVERLPADWAQVLCELASSPEVIAIGEVGLDNTNPRYPPLELQQPVLQQQLQLAAQLRLPAVVHSRGAEEHVAEVCESVGIERVLFHCFTGDRRAARAVIERGYSLSLSGILTFRGSSLADVVRDLPLDRLMVETDTPYLAPVPYRGKRNQPAWVALVGEHLAQVRGITPESCAQQLRDNFDRFFGIPQAT